MLGRRKKKLDTLNFGLTPVSIVQKPIIPNPRRSQKNLSAKCANESWTLSDADSRAPSKEIFHHCSRQMLSSENQTMLSLQVDILRDQIREDINNIQPNRGLALTTNTVYLIFFICKALKLTDGIKFAALEIYDRFTEKYNEEIVRELRKTDKHVIEETNSRLKQQALLRILSCIQLASKVYADSNIPYISSLEVQKILHEFNMEYKLDGINASEVRVIKVLDYKLKYVNSFDIMECILTSLELEVNYARQVYDLAIDALEFVCQRHEEVYTMFLKNWKENCGPKERKLFRAIEFNKAIEAAGVLAGVICILRVKDEKRLLSGIAKISGTDLEDFMILGTILVGIMIGEIILPPVPSRHSF